MAHIQYTISRSGTYYYNRRVPKHAVDSYGQFIRQALSKDPSEAEAFSKRLSDVLEGAWSAATDALADGCGMHGEQEASMSCTTGQAWDADAKQCVDTSA